MSIKEDKKHVAIIFGGQSNEHDVSRVSATYVINNIDRDIFEVSVIGITRDGRWLAFDGSVELMATNAWEAAAEEYTKSLRFSEYSPRGIFRTLCREDELGSLYAVFPVVHGINCEDGTLQGFFELACVPYVGPGLLGSSLGMDKAYSKLIFDHEEIPQGKYLVLTRNSVYELDKNSKAKETLYEKVQSYIGYPCFIKPSNAGSSVGIKKVHNVKDLIDDLIYAAKFDSKVLIEEYFNGREIECAVLGNVEPEASVLGEVVPCNDFYDYEAKYSSGDNSQIIIPADLPEASSKKIREYAIKAFIGLQCSGLSRVDFFVHVETGDIFINEINTLPGFTSISMYPKLWEACGLSYSKLITRLLELAVSRFKASLREI